MITSGLYRRLNLAETQYTCRKFAWGTFVKEKAGNYDNYRLP